MKQKYELWLEESGRFSDEDKLNPNYHSSSMVGGILISSETQKT